MTVNPGNAAGIGLIPVQTDRAEKFTKNRYPAAYSFGVFKRLQSVK
jgi:hypothetical protein